VRKFIYSGFTKVIAVLIFVASCTFSSVVITDGIIRYMSYGEEVFVFERSFDDIKRYDRMLYSVETALSSALREFYLIDENDDVVIFEDKLISVNGKTLSDLVEEKIDNIYCIDDLDYYLEFNDELFINTDKTPEELMLSDFSYYITRDKNGIIETKQEERNNIYDSMSYSVGLWSEYDKESEVKIYTALKDSFINEKRVIWEKQEEIAYDTIYTSRISSGMAIIAFIFLICVCGKDKDNKLKTVWIDKIWLEINITLQIIAAVCAAMAICVLIRAYAVGYFTLHFLETMIGCSVAVLSFLILMLILSVIRNIKCKKFLNSAITVRITIWICKKSYAFLKWLWKKSIYGIKEICKNTKEMISALSILAHKKSGLLFSILLLIYTVIIFLLAASHSFGLLFFIGSIMFITAIFIIAYRIKDIDIIKMGVKEIRNGNTSFKISGIKTEDLKIFAENINDIGKGIDESVAAKIKAEKMKTELITNVSHDIKTPLTSIINYTKLLENVDNLPEDAIDYIKIISVKGQRLKKLTQDLFDISKVQSGNENIISEKINASLLINQSLAELDSEIKESGRTFCVDIEKELYIYADGKKMSRVINNLIDNTIKYSMEGTRVFVKAYEKNDGVIIEIKNISSYPMNFEADEIVGRFARGDESRSEEGNGLGLAIAKSYTEACGGKFDINIDGDMFKAIIKFNRYR